MYTLLQVVVVMLAAAAGQRFGRPQYQPQPLPPGQGFPNLGPGVAPAPGPGLNPGMFPGSGREPVFPSYGDAEGGGGYRGLGSACEYDEHCYFLEHTFCRNQQVCECKRGFLPSDAGDRCLATVGVRCESKFDCAGLGSAGECRQGVCDCSGSSVPSPDGTKCLTGAQKMNDACQFHTQCEPLGEGSLCVGGKCQCAVGRHPRNDKCYINVGLHMACNDHAECYIGEGYESIIYCYMGTCRCREHYRDTPDGKCTSQGTTVRAFLVSMILTFYIMFS